MINQRIIIQKFREYISKFYGSDEYLNKNFRVKEEHSLRVHNNMTALAIDLKLSENETKICECIAIYHDIGRFEQFSRFKTFNDKLTRDHAEWGIEILLKENLIPFLTDKERERVIKPILYHNKKELFKSDIDPAIILYTKMIRDADKLDILKILSSYLAGQTGSNPALLLDLPDSENFTNRIYEFFINEKKLDSKQLKNKLDFILLLCSWTFDIYFNFTRGKILSGNFYSAILDKITDQDAKKKVAEIVFRNLNPKNSNS